MSNAVFLRMLTALAVGFVSGVSFLYFRLRSGLSRREWIYFKAFLQSLRDGTYDDSEIERSEEDEGE